jgi:hypothetical protein
VVVAVALTEVEPLADADVNVPGVMVTFVAPVVAQLNVLLDPDAMLVSLAVKEVIVGFAPVTVDGGTRLHPVIPAQIHRIRKSAHTPTPRETLRHELGMLLESRRFERVENFFCSP